MEKRLPSPFSLPPSTFRLHPSPSIFLLFSFPTSTFLITSSSSSLPYPPSPLSMIFLPFIFSVLPYEFGWIFTPCLHCVRIRMRFHLTLPVVLFSFSIFFFSLLICDFLLSLPLFQVPTFSFVFLSSVPHLSLPLNKWMTNWTKFPSLPFLMQYYIQMVCAELW